jgi:hypothetical protein
MDNGLEIGHFQKMNFNEDDSLFSILYKGRPAAARIF